MYKLFPSLLLTNSNIAVTFMPTGFKENMSRMLRELPENEQHANNESIQLEGKLYVVKENIYEQYLNRDEQVACITYTQFVQRYEKCPVPKNKNYDMQKGFYRYLGNQDIRNILEPKT